MPACFYKKPIHAPVIVHFLSLSHVELMSMQMHTEVQPLVQEPSPLTKTLKHTQYLPQPWHLRKAPCD